MAGIGVRDVSKGRAQGKDRDYQIQCRDVLIHRNQSLVPYSGDGIDVPFDVGGTTWSLDVALRDSSGEAVIAECRRREATVKQEEVAAFAYKVEQLRQALSLPIAGVFFAKSGHQLGALKVGNFEGITMVILPEGEKPPGFSIVFQHYDSERAKRMKHYVLHAAPGRYTISGS